MNKIEFSKLKNKENKQIAFNQLKDDYKTLYKEKDKLESNWKTLKEWLIEQRKSHFYVRDENGTKCGLTKHSKIIAEKVNELVKAVNYLLDKDNNG